MNFPNIVSYNFINKNKKLICIFCLSVFGREKGLGDQVH